MASQSLATLAALLIVHGRVESAVALIDRGRSDQNARALSGEGLGQFIGQLRDALNQHGQRLMDVRSVSDAVAGVVAHVARSLAYVDLPVLQRRPLAGVGLYELDDFLAQPFTSRMSTTVAGGGKKKRKRKLLDDISGLVSRRLLQIEPNQPKDTIALRKIGPADGAGGPPTEAEVKAAQRSSHGHYDSQLSAWITTQCVAWP